MQLLPPSMLDFLNGTGYCWWNDRRALGCSCVCWPQWPTIKMKATETATMTKPALLSLNVSGPCHDRLWETIRGGGLMLEAWQAQDPLPVRPFDQPAYYPSFQLSFDSTWVFADDISSNATKATSQSDVRNANVAGQLARLDIRLERGTWYVKRLWTMELKTDITRTKKNEGATEYEGEKKYTFCLPPVQFLRWGVWTKTGRICGSM